MLNRIYNLLNNNKPYEAEKLLKNQISKFDFIDLHFLYNKFQEVFYKNRKENIKYIEKAKEYCLKDIKIIDENLNTHFVFQVARHPSVIRLINIYEKAGEIDDAIAVCKWAIDNRLMGKFLNKLKLLYKKKDNQ